MTYTTIRLPECCPAAVAITPDRAIWAISDALSEEPVQLFRAGIEDALFQPIALAPELTPVWPGPGASATMAASEHVVAAALGPRVLIVRDGTPALVTIPGSAESIAVLDDTVFVATTDGTLLRVDARGTTKLDVAAWFVVAAGGALHIPADDEIVVCDGTRAVKHVPAPGLVTKPKAFQVASDGTYAMLYGDVVYVFHATGGARAKIETKEGRYATMCISSHDRIVIGRLGITNGAYFDLDGNKTGKAERPFSNAPRKLVAGPDGIVAEVHAHSVNGVPWYSAPAPRRTKSGRSIKH